MKRYFFGFLAGLVFGACQHITNTDFSGNYTINIEFLDEKSTYQMPFTAKIDEANGKLSIQVVNAGETIDIKEISVKDDSLIFMMPVFLSEFRLKKTTNGFKGIFIKRDREQPVFYEVTAQKDAPRFPAKPSSFNVQGKYKTKFVSKNGQSYPAIAEFNQNKHIVTGTFLTETGDYRFLEGVVSADTLKLSGFDGSHLFLFEAKIYNNDSLSGIFKGSHTHIEKFYSSKNPDFSLRSADSLTFLKPEYSGISFSFPDLDSQLVHFPAKKFEGKVVIIQLMGSWCPNCMDETAFLVKLHQQYASQGLEIIGLAFEHFKNFKKASKAVNRVKNHFNASYTFCIAGTSNKQKAAEALPMINHVISFPTLIIIDKNGEVQKIHTGFAGPGTSEYSDFVRNTEAFILNLLQQ